MNKPVKKPWYRQFQVFMPWYSVYLGVQFGNSFFGWQVRTSKEPY